MQSTYHVTGSLTLLTYLLTYLYEDKQPESAVLHFTYISSTIALSYYALIHLGFNFNVNSGYQSFSTCFRYKI